MQVHTTLVHTRTMHMHRYTLCTRIFNIPYTIYRTQAETDVYAHIHMHTRTHTHKTLHTFGEAAGASFFTLGVAGLDGDEEEVEEVVGDKVFLGVVEDGAFFGVEAAGAFLGVEEEEVVAGAATAGGEEEEAVEEGGGEEVPLSLAVCKRIFFL